MPMHRWTYNDDDGVWELQLVSRYGQSSRVLYNVASNRQPTKGESRRIFTRLARFYPWLEQA